jgi:predicted HTH transcriptional regulator
MTAYDIQKILLQGEGVSVEFKKTETKDPSSLYETVVSFANTNDVTDSQHTIRWLFLKKGTIFRDKK